MKSFKNLRVVACRGDKRCYTPWKSVIRRFTLIEILIVCSLIAFLAAVTIVGVSFAMRTAGDANCRSLINQINLAMNEYKAVTGYFIQQPKGNGFYMDKPKEGEVDLTDFLPTYEKWCTNGTIERPYERSAVCDPAGTTLWYRCPGSHNKGSFDFESAGQDGIFGYYEESDDQNYSKTINQNHTDLGTGGSAPEDGTVLDNINNWDIAR